MVTKAEVKKVMSALGKKTSPAKAAAARRNAKLGGRPKKQLVIKRIESIAFDPDAAGPRIEYVTKGQLRKLYPRVRNPQKKAPVAAKGTRQIAERV